MKKVQYILREEYFGKIIYDIEAAEVYINKSIPVSPDKIRHIRNAKKNILSAPLTVFLELTEKCNLSCKHCLNEPNSNAKISLAEWFSIIDQLYENGVFSVKITGGEPFIRSDIIQVLNYLDSKQISYIIYSNGTLINKYINDLSELKYLSKLRISLDGPEKINDAIRGKNTYKQVLETLVCLQEKNIPFEINYTITRSNYHEIETLGEDLKRKGLDGKINLGFIKISGSAIHNLTECFVDPNDLNECTAYLASYIKDQPQIKSFYLLKQTYLDLFGKQFGCPAGKTNAVIKNNGNMFACGLFSGNKDLVCGNILNESLSKIWSGTKMDFIRNLKPFEKCTTCPKFKNGCTGGCRGNALNFKNDIEGEDINCSVYLTNFSD